MDPVWYEEGVQAAKDEQVRPEFGQVNTATAASDV